MALRGVAVVLLLLALPLVAPVSGACAAIPCGRIYPIILLQSEAKPGSTYDLGAGSPLTVDLLLTFSFDAAKDGYTPTMPNDPIFVSFEFPRKPGWADVRVEPERIQIPVNDPTHFKPDPSDPGNPKLVFAFVTSIQTTVTLTGQAVLKDGLDYHKLLVFAKSTESGIFQSGYGIKEIRVVPEGAVHESDVAGQRDVFTASPLPGLVLAEASASFAGTTVSLTPPASAAWWQPLPFEVRVDPPFAGRMMAALHDEAGSLVAHSGLLDASAGVGAFNVTLVRPGHHTATVTLLPDPGQATLPVTHALPLPAGDASAEGFVFPKSMRVAVTDDVPAPNAHRGQDPRDALVQFERDVPFYAFDTAQGVTVLVGLRAAPLKDLATGPANLQFSVLDPDGSMLQTATVDPANPIKGYRIGSVPMEGWYTLRINGIGAPLGGRYDAAVEVAYGQAPQARNRADGTPDATAPLLGFAGLNLTLPLDALRVWTSGDLTPILGEGVRAQHAITVTDAEGNLVQATRLREGAATFTPPWPGTYRAFVHVQPALGEKPFSPLVRAFTFAVGEGETVEAQSFPLVDEHETPVSPRATPLGVYALPRVDGGKLTLGEGLAAAVVDAEGQPAEGTSAASARYVLVSTPGPTRGETVAFSADAAFPAPVTMVGPEGPTAQGTRGATIPGFAVGLVLAVVGAAAVAVTLLRRR